MIKTLSLSLNFITGYAKRLILNNYYYHFYYYIHCPKRKRNYLQFKHLKYSKSIFSIKSIIKAKTKNWKKQIGF